MTAKSDYFMPRALRARFSDELGLRKYARSRDGDSVPYQLGLALGGGGSKAASYAIGILSGLHDESNDGLASRIDAISSVSGGSYAALWYYSRLIDEYQIYGEHGGEKKYATEKLFSDCLPLRYAGLTGANAGDRLCNDTAAQYHEAEKGNRDPDRFQNHLRGFQDLFSKDFNLDPTSQGADSNRAVVRAGKELIYTLPVLLPHWIANGIFDWEINISPSGSRYFNGIARTYGHRPTDCNDFRELARDTKLDEWTVVCRGDAGRPSPNVEVARGKTMAALSNLYYQQDVIRQADLAADNAGEPKADAFKPPKIPFWIANATAGVERRRWSFGGDGRADLEDSVFELTPYSFGSRHFGRWVGTPAGLELAEIAGASGAFLDAQQRTLHPIKNAIGSAAMSIFAASWGVSIPNPRWRNEARLTHRLMPWPFYLFHRNSPDRDGAWIHLSDGGQSENTGVWSLVRRGVTTILVADEAYDGTGKFDDLCYLRGELGPRSLYLRVPDLEGFDALCEGRLGSEAHYDLWNFPKRILVGCITSESTDIDCEGAPAKYFAQLLILKPAIDLGVLRPFLAKCEPRDLAIRDQTPAGLSCRQALQELRAERGYDQFPSELFGFLVNNLRTTSPTALSFPQSSTVWMTLNSSPTLFGAYRELARWQMTGIVEVVGKRSAPRSAPVRPTMR